MVPDKHKVCTYGSLSSSESFDLLLGLGELVLRSKRLQDLKDEVPELFMVLVEEHNQTGAL
jgi:hypothetical protein